MPKLNFAVIQSGYAVFGAGPTEWDAYVDAARWMVSSNGRGCTPDWIAGICVARPNDGDFYILERDDDPETFDLYMRNQGGFEFRDGGWQEIKND